MKEGGRTVYVYIGTIGVLSISWVVAAPFPYYLAPSLSTLILLENVIFACFNNFFFQKGCMIFIM